MPRSLSGWMPPKIETLRFSIIPVCRPTRVTE